MVCMRTQRHGPVLDSSNNPGGTSHHSTSMRCVSWGAERWRGVKASGSILEVTQMHHS